MSFDKTSNDELDVEHEETNSWYEDNQQYLMAAMARVTEALQLQISNNNSYIDSSKTSDSVFDIRISELAERMTVAPALESLCICFNLSAFERDILLMCAALELDGGFAALCASEKKLKSDSLINSNLNSSTTSAQHNIPSTKASSVPSFGLAMAALPNAFWAAITPAAALRHWRLIEVSGGDTLTNSSLRIDERILHYLTGLNYLDERLKHFIEPLNTSGELCPSQLKQSVRIQELWTKASRESDWPLIQLCGIETNSKIAVISNACVALKSQAYVVQGADIPSSIIDRKSLAHLWQREILLSRYTLVVECDEFNANEVLPKMISFIKNIQGPVIIMRRDPVQNLKCTSIRLDINKPIIEEQQQLWQRGLAPLADKINGELLPLVEQFNLGADDIQAATLEVLADPDIWQEHNNTSKVLWRACRSQTRRGLDDLAQRIEPMATWDELVLPESQKQTLKQLIAHVHQRRTVYQRWGFATKSNRGLGISALLAGASGTGKTMAAEVLAGELELDLYRIDLSSVVSKYIGETEKNLRRLFDAAEAGSAILLFDEADALFGKRSEVKDSHDRYANIEVSYLLQRMECYLGLSILTSNLKSSIDSAFLRRIRFVIQFPFPDELQRCDIWQGIYPSITPTRDLAISKLAKLSITGGNIRNIALNAAFLAAEANEPVTMYHLQEATRAEYLKLEKPLTDSEINGWVMDNSSVTLEVNQL